MAKKKEQTPTGFDELLNIYGNSDEQEGVTDIDEQVLKNMPSIEDNVKNDTPDPEEGTEDGKTKDDDTTVATTDNSDIPEDVLNQMNNASSDQQTEPDTDTTEDDEPSQEDLAEAQQVSTLFDALGESMGWNMAELGEDEKPVTVDELTYYLQEVVRQNSIPQYGDDRVRQLDEYVKNGGKFEDFYQKQQQALSIDNLDMDDEANQKAVVRELLQRSGYTDEQINSKINRYLDADMLVEESEDALERLKVIHEKEVEQYQQQQEEAARVAQENSKRFFDDVTNSIQNLTDIRGIAIPKEDRRALLDYIFKVDQNGETQYQKEFNANLAKNLIESAYFTMKADQFVTTAKKTGETSAAEKLRKMLRHTTKNHSSYNVNEKQKSVIDLASGLF